MRAVRACMAALLVLLAAILLPGSAAEAARADMIRADMIRVGLQLEPPNLDPTSGSATTTDEVVHNTIFESLVRMAPNGMFRPWLATRWTVSDDGLTYTFDLRKDVRFHDGTPLTAEDVVFSLTRAGRPDSTNAQAAAFSRIAFSEALGPHRVRMTLPEPDSAFLTLLSLGDAAIVSRKSADQLATHPIGTGPFRFADWRRGDIITLKANPDYWGRKPRIQWLTFRFLGDPNAAYAAMRSGDIDVFPDFPAPETLEQLRADKRLKLAIMPSEGEVILSINQRRGPLANLKVRQAIAHALDRSAIIQGAVYGYGTAISSHFPPQSPDYVDLSGLYPFDPARARQLLAEAGYPDGFSVTMKLPPLSYARRTGEVVAAQLAAIGIRAEIRNLEWAGWLDEVFTRHEYDLTVVNHAEPFDYDIYGRADYYFGYDSPEYRALLAELKAARDPLTRHHILGALQRKMAEDAVNGFLFQYPYLGVQVADLQDIWVNTPNQLLDYTMAHYAGRGAAAGGGDGAAVSDGTLWGWGLGAAVLALLALAVASFGPGYVLGRLAVLVGTLFAAAVVIFLMIQIVPGDPAAFMMGLNATPQGVAALRAELGLDGPALARFFDWLIGMLHGDFGISYTYRVPVAGLIADGLTISLPLALFATVLSILIGVPAGYAAASRSGGWVDGAMTWLARLGIAIPSFWLGILLVLVFSVGLGWTASGGFPGWQAGLGPALGALALPTVALALPQAAILARVTRASLLDVLKQDFVRTARAKGLSRRATLFRHALPNALGPVLTVLGLQVPFLLAGSAIVESQFYLPGLGRLVLQAIAKRDLIAVQGVAMLFVAFTVLASFLVDMAYAFVDPRLRDRRAQ